MIFRMVRLSGPHDIQNGKVVPEIIQEGHELFFVEVFTVVKLVTMSQSLGTCFSGLLSKSWHWELLMVALTVSLCRVSWCWSS